MNTPKGSNMLPAALAAMLTVACAAGNSQVKEKPVKPVDTAQKASRTKVADSLGRSCAAKAGVSVKELDGMEHVGETVIQGNFGKFFVVLVKMENGDIEVRAFEKAAAGLKGADGTATCDLETPSIAGLSVPAANALFADLRGASAEDLLERWSAVQGKLRDIFVKRQQAQKGECDYSSRQSAEIEYHKALRHWKLIRLAAMRNSDHDRVGLAEKMIATLNDTKSSEAVIEKCRKLAKKLGFSFD